MIKKFESMKIEVKYPTEFKQKLYVMDIRPTLLDRIKESQEKDKECKEMKKRIPGKEDDKCGIDNDETLGFEQRM